MKESNKKLPNNMYIILSAIFVGVAVFYGTYYFFISKSQSAYITKINTEVNNINKINEASYMFTKGQTIDVDKIRTSLSDSIASLQASRVNLNNLAITDKYSDDYNNLILGLNNNILIYKQALSIVRGPKSQDLDSSLVQLQKSRDDCMNYYALVSIKNIKITLPKESLDFLNNAIAYTQKQIRQNTDAQIVSSQNHDFLLSFNELSTEFTISRRDYTNSISNARNNLGGYDNLLIEMTNVESSLNEMKTNLSNLTIPKDAIPVYNAFAKALNEYETYIQNLKYAIKTEQLTSVSGVSNTDSLNNLYTSSQKQLKVVENAYTSFIKLYNEFENKTI